jgi:WD40 repeat protein
VAGLSNNTITIFDSLNLTSTTSLKLSGPVTGVVSSPLNDNLIYTGTSEAVKLWDLRTSTSKSVHQFEATFEGQQRKKKPLTAFDVNKDDLFLASGTEVVGHDAFLIFWDIRGKKNNLRSVE